MSVETYHHLGVVIWWTLDLRGVDVRGLNSSGDGIVRFQGTAALVGTLMRRVVTLEKLRIQWFTGLDHSITIVGQNGFLYRYLTDELFEEKGWKVENVYGLCSLAYLCTF